MISRTTRADSSRALRTSVQCRKKHVPGLCGFFTDRVSQFERVHLFLCLRTVRRLEAPADRDHDRFDALTLDSAHRAPIETPEIGFSFSEQIARDNIIWAIIALSVYHAAFVCEALRSGVNTVPVGQAEAASLRNCSPSRAT